MLKLEPRVFGLTFQALFPKPVPFPTSTVLVAAEEIAEAFQLLGLRPTQIELNKRDDIFNYDLRLTLFNGNATFSLNSERMEIIFTNAISREDLSLIGRSLLTFQDASHLPDTRSNVFSAHVHGKPESDKDCDDYFATFAKQRDTFVLRGLIATTRVASWADEIRLYLERSQRIPGGLFLNWTTNLVGGSISQEILETLVGSIETASNMAGIAFSPLK